MDSQQCAKEIATLLYVKARYFNTDFMGVHDIQRSVGDSLSFRFVKMSLESLGHKGIVEGVGENLIARQSTPDKEFEILAQDYRITDSGIEAVESWHIAPGKIERLRTELERENSTSSSESSPHNMGNWEPLPIDSEELSSARKASVVEAEQLAESVENDNGDWEIVPGERKARANSINHFASVLQYQQVVLSYHFDTFANNITRLKAVFAADTRIGMITRAAATAIGGFLIECAKKVGKEAIINFIKSKLGLDD